MNESMKFIVENVKGLDKVKLIRIIGELDAGNSNNLMKIIDFDVPASCVTLIFDCSDLSFIDSSGNFAFFQIHVKMRKRGGSVKIFNINKNIRKILDIIGIFKIIDVYYTYEETIESIKKEI